MSSPWSSSLSAKFLSLAADQLNAIHHVRFRSVCSLWRKSTTQRNALPLIILADTGLHEQDKPIKALSFFDTVRKETIPCPAITGDDVRNSFFLGSSHGYLAIGCLDPQLKILLVNPFTSSIIKLPVLTGEDLGGRVIISGSLMEPEFFNTMVVYYKKNSAHVCFMRFGDNRWNRLTLPGTPEDIITADGSLYVNFGSQIFYTILDKNWIAPAPFPPKFLGVFPNWYSPNLKFAVNSSGKLFVVCTLSFERKDFGFMHMEFNGIWPGVFPYVDKLGQYCYPVLALGKSPRRVLMVHDFHPYGPFSWLSKFWSDGQHPWEPVGWIYPNLNVSL